MIALLRRWWFFLGVALAASAAWATPLPPPGPAPEWPDLVRDLLVIIIAILAGASLPLQRAGPALRDWRSVLFIQGFGFLLMPALAWGLAATLNGIGSPPYVGEGLVLLACLPTTVAGSITLSRLAGDDGSTAAVNAIVGNLLGIIPTPLLILVLTARVDFYGSPELIARLALIIALPMAVGLCIGRLSGVQRLRPWATSAMQSFLLGLLYLAFMRAAWRDVHVPLAEVLIIIVLAGVFYVAMLFCADALAQALGYREPRRSCLAIAGGQKTLAFGIPILSLVFEDTPALALMLLPLLAYHPLQILIGTIFAQQRGKALEAPCDNAPSS